MSETLIQRVTRMMSAAAHQLVNSTEGHAPEAIMEEAIREMGGAIDEVEHARGAAVARRHLAQQRLAKERERHGELENQVQLAIDRGRDDLAEVGMSKMLDIEAQLPVLEQSAAQAESEREDHERYIEALKGRKNEMQDEHRALRAAKARQETGSAESVADAHARSTSAAGRSAERASSAFENVRSAITGDTYAGESAAIGTGRNASQLAELDALARKHRIEERLRALKSHT